MQSKPRWCLRVHAAIVLSACVVGFHPATAKAAPTQAQAAKVGSFQVPVLPGAWIKRSAKSGGWSNVSYGRSVQGTGVSVKFARFAHGKSKTVAPQDLKTNAKDTERVMKENFPSHKTLESKATKFRGYPAYLTRGITTQKEGVTDLKQLDFIYNGDLYRLSVALVGKRHSPQAKAAAEQAWQTMIQKLQV